MKNITAVFLDAGGVILDETYHEDQRAELIVSIIKRYKPEYSTGQYWKDIRTAVHRFIPRAFWYVLWLNSGDIKQFRDMRTDFRDRWKSGTHPLTLMKGIAEVLPALAGGYNVGILGQYGPALREILERNSLLEHFSYTNTQEEFRITKPNPDYFRQVLDRAGVQPENAVMVGDRIDKDVMPAKRIGMRTIRIITGIHAEQQARHPGEEPDKEISAITELPGALKELTSVP